MTRNLAALLSILSLLSGCESPVSGRYAVSTDTNITIKNSRLQGVGVGVFVTPTSFSASCRLAGTLEVPDNLTHTEYIRKAFEQELKAAGALESAAPRIILKGKVERLEFSSTRALTGGSWIIDLELASSNGRKLRVSENYEYKTGFDGMAACKQTAEAFPRAVQDLIAKVVSAPEFAALTR